MRWHERIKSRLKLRGAFARFRVPAELSAAEDAGPPLGQASCSLIEDSGAVARENSGYGSAFSVRTG
jgi:hypothetical protein